MKHADGRELIAMTENVSDEGALIGTPHHLAIGDELSVTTTQGALPLRARVVRFEKNDRAETLLWRFHAALIFDGDPRRFVS